MTHKTPLIITITILALLALAAGITAIALSLNSPTAAAERCMSELDYEGAIAEYERVIDGDPENVMAYAGLIKACEAVGDPYRAEEVRRRAFRFTGDERFSEALIAESEDRTPGGVSIGRGGVSIGDERQEEEEAAPVAVQETTKAPAVTSAPETTTAKKTVTAPEKTTVHETTTTQKTTTAPATTAAPKTTTTQKTTKKPAATEDLSKIPIGESELELAVAKLIKNPQASVDQSLLDSVTEVYILGEDFISVNRRIEDYYPYHSWRFDDSSFTFIMSDGMEDTYSYGSISSLDFAGRLKNLKSLAVEFNKLNDISALSKLTKLNVLNLSFNRISDLTPLSGLTSLKSLTLQRNRISNLSSLGSLTKLKELYLDYNSIKDISALKKLTSLDILWLSRNEISDLSPLSKLTGLVSLNLIGNKISDVTPLSKLTKLTELRLYNNKISDITPLGSLKSLKTLWIYENDKVTQAKVDALQKKLPDCEIKF